MALSNAERQRRYRDRRKRELADLRKAYPYPAGEAGKGYQATRRRVREALGVLAGQGSPEAVAGYFDGSDEAILVAERLDRAVTWLIAFTEAFNGARRPT